MSDQCIFCKILDGSIPSIKVYEDDSFIAILDIAPAQKGHTILISKKHIPDLISADDAILEKMLPLAKKITSAIKTSLNCDGINILQNNAPAAGQTVFHLHMHIIPRYENDDCAITWTPSSYQDGEAAQLATKITESLS